jgi:peptide deformylase
MVPEPLDQHDLRLRQKCQVLTRQVLKLRSQQEEIDTLLDVVFERQDVREQAHREQNTRVPSTVGLSANQVGIMKRICVVDLAIGRRGQHDIMVLINPEIVWQSQTQAERVEGCVNFGSCWGVTRRPTRLKVKALTRQGQELIIDALC